ncbi:MAG: 5'/3'-nucleotidase SurE [Firmicutes bacterium]|nr:5'/3'-nucleotidase SurE [Bacillota bacterium]
MNILLTNDDGIQSSGLRILAEALLELGDIYIAAPSLEQSGVSHGLTAHVPLRAHRIDYAAAVKCAWSIDGTPADCVKLTIERLLPQKPDVVISGINFGANLGTDVIYSGTVAGAMEGYLFGLPAMALSVTGIRRGVGQGNFAYAARLCQQICLTWQQQDFKPRTMLNINVPGQNPQEIKGVRFTRLGWRWYHDAYEQRLDPNGRPYYWLQGTAYDGEDPGDTDVSACREGVVSITPLFNDMTDTAALQTLQHTFDLPR